MFNDQKHCRCLGRFRAKNSNHGAGDGASLSFPGTTLLNITQVENAPEPSERLPVSTIGFDDMQEGSSSNHN